MQIIIKVKMGPEGKKIVYSYLFCVNLTRISVIGQKNIKTLNYEKIAKLLGTGVYFKLHHYHTATI